MLGNISGCATVLAAQRQALKHAQHHQNDRCSNADTGIGRQQANGKGRQAHQHDGDQEGVLASDHVAQAAEHQRAEGPHQETGGEGHQGKDKGSGVVHTGKELLADDRGQCPIKKKVIPLENCPEG
ncbi:hypothetical protein D3C85_1619530 [compost metagenome]